MNKTVIPPLEREEKAIYMGRIRVRTLKRANKISSVDHLRAATCALSNCN